MNRIERYLNWCSIDRLDGLDLNDGELLIVAWPDGQLQQVQICVARRTFSHGNPCDGEGIESHAFAVAYHRGVQVKVPLLGLEAQRVIQ